MSNSVKGKEGASFYFSFILKNENCWITSYDSAALGIQGVDFYMFLSALQKADECVVSALANFP